MAQVWLIFSLSTYGNKTIEEVANVSGKNPFFFQLYMSKNNQFNEFILQSGKHGAKAIILTVDSPVGGYREEDIKNNFQFPLVLQTRNVRRKMTMVQNRQRGRDK